MLWGLWGIHINIECDLGNCKALSLTFEKNQCIMGIHPNVFGIRTDVSTPMLVSISTYLDDARHIWCIFCIFGSTLWICLVMVKRAIGHILGIVGVIDMKQKGNFMIGCRVHYVTLTLDLTDGLDLRFPRENFQIACHISGIGRLLGIEWKKFKLIICGHDFELGVTMVQWVDVIGEWPGWLNMSACCQYNTVWHQDIKWWDPR